MGNKTSTVGVCRKCGLTGHMEQYCRNALADLPGPLSTEARAAAAAAATGPSLSDITLDSDDFSDAEGGRRRDRSHKEKRSKREKKDNKEKKDKKEKKEKKRKRGEGMLE